MLVELSYPFDPRMPVYPGSPKEDFRPHTRLSQGQESNTTVITHYLHGGSHVDAPFHFYDPGATIDQIPIENFVFDRPLVVDAPLAKGGLITVEDLKKAGEQLPEADILLLRTGYSALRDKAEVYTDDFPALSEEAARLIRTELLRAKAVAIDSLSIESATRGPAQGFPVHKTLLAGDRHRTRPLLVFEDLDLSRMENGRIKRIYAFPLRLKGLDASPVNVVAELFD